MATETDDQTVSKESYERLKRELDAKDAKLSEATKALGAMTKRDRARAALKGKVGDPDSIADLVSPHLDDVELDAIPEFLASERFAALYAASPVQTPPGDGDGGEPPPPAQEPPQGGFGGPSPAGDGTGQGGAGKEKMAFSSPEFQRLIASGDEEAIAAAYENDLVAETARPW